MQIRTATTAQTPEELLNDLRTLVGDAELMLNPARGETRSEPLVSLRARYDAAQKSLGEFYTGTKTKIAASAQYTDASIRAHPYQSLVIALGAGLLIGVVLGRRSR
jgi:ElaB/YqjD/DUF883 family membrane-anchored ribosome-binding protein